MRQKQGSDDVMMMASTPAWVRGVATFAIESDAVKDGTFGEDVKMEKEKEW